MFHSKVIDKSVARSLALEYQDTNEDVRRNEIAELLICANIKLVVNIANNYTSPNRSNYQDYIIIGCGAIIECIPKYDGSIRFSTYIYQNIRWKMENYRERKSNIVKRVYQFDGEGESNYLDYDLCVPASYQDEEVHIFPVVNQLLKCKSLTDYERDILKNRISGLPFTEIAKSRGVSGSSVRLSHKNAVAKLKHYARQLKII